MKVLIRAMGNSELVVGSRELIIHLVRDTQWVRRLQKRNLGSWIFCPSEFSGL